MVSCIDPPTALLCPNSVCALLFVSCLVPVVTRTDVCAQMVWESQLNQWVTCKRRCRADQGWSVLWQQESLAEYQQNRQTTHKTICHRVVGHHMGVHPFKTALWSSDWLALLPVSSGSRASGSLRHDLVLAVRILACRAELKNSESSRSAARLRDVGNDKYHSSNQLSVLKALSCPEHGPVWRIVASCRMPVFPLQASHTWK